MENKFKNNIVVKSNKLIEASYRLTITEQKILYMIIAMIKPSDKDFREYEFKVSDFINLLGIKGQNKYSTLKDVTRLLRSRTFTLKTIDKSIEIQTGWVSSALYKNNEGKVVFYLDPILKPFLLQLQSKFTSMKLENLMQLRSIYSTRIYELLKQYQNIKKRTLTIAELREILVIDENKYKLYHQLKQRVLLQSQKEINEKTDIKFTFEEIKTGRKVTELRFFIEQKNEKKEHKKMQNKQVVDTLENKEDLRFVYMLLSDKLSEGDCNKLYIAANCDLKKVKRAYELSLKQRNIKNLFAWIKDCIEKDYSIPVAVTNLDEKTDTFNDFPQRIYDFEDLEAKLLGRK
ncbi:replication initiation protein [Clostridium botulinum C]|uniref:replication initiation protein n=1 Tax=Clostridium botulinum TaxID=1491 RepID=UPI001E5A8CA5|nr:replication initiation protein [Clostridium botulinum]MCD3218136.1 replication initiation protein [Clostridium botulinum C]